jgi:hypothetical protein
MGFLKDLRDLNKKSKEVSAGFDPAAQMREASAAMAGMTQMMEQQTLGARLASTGESATAQVTALRDTAQQVNGQPVVEIDLLVFPTGRPPYPVTVSQIVQLSQIARLTPGSTLTVKIDPAEVEAIWIDWAAST